MCTTPPEETIEHLIFHCPFSRACWTTLNISWQQYGNRLQITKQAKPQWARPMFMEIFIVGAWSVRKERNNFLFNNITPELESWKRRFIRDFSLLIHRTEEDLHPLISSFANSLSFIFFSF
jgi:hypothetical protein